ncbi:hypothetical protein KY349_05300 [Candidatus Woesearchaeota archaeon]|jgi:hypothetical protein|nr:hypothetical protein [Candidatus Woesearchaeota archaeon]
MAEKRGYATYLAYFGLVLVILTVVNLFVSDVYPEYKKCEQIIDPLYSLLGEGEGIIGEQMVTIDGGGSGAVSAIIQRCNNVQNDVFISYVLISVGVAFIIGGLITIREKR